MMTSLIETIKNNTTGFGEVLRQFFLLLMALGWMNLNEMQFIGLMQFISAAIAFVTIKTTISTNKVDARVEERVAHRELAGTAGSPDGMTPAKPPSVITLAHRV